MRADAPVDELTFLVAVALARDAADENKASPQLDLIEKAVELHGNARQGKSIGAERYLFPGKFYMRERSIDFLNR